MNIKKVVLGLMVAVFFCTFFWTSGVGAVNVFDTVCERGVTDPPVSQSAVCRDAQSTGNPLVGPGGIITVGAQILAAITGIIAVFVIIIGGFKYVTSAGDGNSTKAAKDTILYAVIGLAVATVAQMLVTFVLSKL